MAVRERGYEHWSGRLQEEGWRAWPIFSLGVKKVWHKRYAKLLLSSTAFPGLILLLLVIALAKPELKLFTSQIKNMVDAQTMFYHYFANGFLSLMLVIVSIFSGSELISGDLQANAFPLYFSRPLARRDYLSAKIGAVFFFLVLPTFLPAVLVLAAIPTFSAPLALSLRTIAGVMVFPLILALFFASFTLAVSIFTRSKRFSGLIIFLIYMATDLIGTLSSALLGKDGFLLFSIQKNISQAAAFVFTAKPPHDFPASWAFFFFPAMTLVCLFILDRVVRRFETSR